MIKRGGISVSKFVDPRKFLFSRVLHRPFYSNRESEEFKVE